MRIRHCYCDTRAFRLEKIKEQILKEMDPSRTDTIQEGKKSRGSIVHILWRTYLGASVIVSDWSVLVACPNGA